METNWIKKKKIFSKRWFLTIAVFLLLTIPLVTITFWVNWAMAAPKNSGKEKIFVIKENESIISIAKRLKAEGLIRDETVFRIYTRINCKGIDFKNLATLFKKYPPKDCLSGNIQAGSFKLSPALSLATLSLKLTNGKIDSWIKIVEGLRNEEIAQKLEKQFPIKKDDFLKIAEIGYMFPDTYLFKVNSTAAEVVEKLRQTFDLRFEESLQEKVKAQGLTVNEAVILASIIERESRDTDERPIIAGILLKRLFEGWRLEVDATIQYALGYDQENKTWWKKSLTIEDLAIDSPYNSRKFAGLPPTPIANPGLSSLKAVAQPVESSYYFYLHDSKGEIHFAKTLNEHNSNKVKYL